MTKDEALKLALDAFEDIFGKNKVDVTVINVIKEALAQPEQDREEMKIKTVTMRCKDYDVALPIIYNDFGRVLVGQPCIPPQRTWVVFPTMLRKMWSGSEVQAWLDENVNKENT